MIIVLLSSLFLLLPPGSVVMVQSEMEPTYADSKADAPTTTVPPEMETDFPNLSSAAPSDAVSLEVWVHVVPFFLNTYAEPELEPPSSSPYALTTTVSPEMETESPKLSAAAPSDATSLEVWLHVVPLFSKTYTEPEEVPPSSS